MARRLRAGAHRLDRALHPHHHGPHRAEGQKRPGAAPARLRPHRAGGLASGHPPVGLLREGRAEPRRGLRAPVPVVGPRLHRHGPLRRLLRPAAEEARLPSLPACHLLALQAQLPGLRGRLHRPQAPRAAARLQRLDHQRPIRDGLPVPGRGPPAAHLPRPLARAPALPAGPLRPLRRAGHAPRAGVSGLRRPALPALALGIRHIARRGDVMQVPTDSSLWRNMVYFAKPGP